MSRPVEQAPVRYRSAQAGPVRLAHDQAQGRDVRLVLVPDLGADPRRQSDLQARLRALEQVQLPRVVPVLEIVEQDGGTWAVTPLPPGRPLHQLADQPLDRPALAADLVGALTALHELGVAHGAVGPTSCRVAPNGAGLDVPALAPGDGQSPAADRAALAAVLDALVDEPDGAVATLVRELRAAPVALPEPVALPAPADLPAPAAPASPTAPQLTVAPAHPPAPARSPNRSPGSAAVQPVAAGPPASAGARPLTPVAAVRRPAVDKPPVVRPDPVTGARQPADALVLPVDAPNALSLRHVDRPDRPERVRGRWRRRPLLEGLALALVALVSLLALLIVL